MPVPQLHGGGPALVYPPNRSLPDMGGSHPSPQYAREGICMASVTAAYQCQPRAGQPDPSQSPNDRRALEQVGTTVVMRVSRELFGIRSGCGRVFRGHREMLPQ